MKKICVFTGSRAEYGLLKPVIERIEGDVRCVLQLLASGTHLSGPHGMTIDAIRADGFAVDAKVPLPLGEDSAVGMARAMGDAVAGSAEALADLTPEMVVVLGDRYEGLACGLAATMLQIPVAHIHGGESSEGAVDEYFRHALTKLSLLHFTSCEVYRHRVVQLGEDPKRVFDVGSLGVENVRGTALMELDELEKALGFALGSECLLGTFHPVTLCRDTDREAHEFFAGLDAVLAERKGIRVILTGANADAGGMAVDARARAFADRWGGRVLVSPSLGMVRYLSAMKRCAAVVGNSSSGIIEAPAMGIPVVNVGKRQAGRVRAASVLDTRSCADAVRAAVLKALSPEFVEVARQAVNPYEKSGTSQRIVDVIVEYYGSSVKTFYDIPFPLSEQT